MAWSNTKKQEPKREDLPHFGVDDWQLFVFQQKEIKDANSDVVKYIRMDAKVSSKPAEGAKYGDGVQIQIMCTVDGTRQTEIEPEDYSKRWVRVTGRFSAADSKDPKSGLVYTNLTIWADKLKLAPAK